MNPCSSLSNFAPLGVDRRIDGAGLVEQRNCHCLTRIAPITRIEPVALPASVLGWTVSLFKGNDLGQS